MQSSIKSISPDVASSYLLANYVDNRNVSQSRVDHYAKMMTDGEWQLSHQGLAFDKKGTLIDGQHRLLAIVKSGVTVQMMVTTGVDTSAYSTFDAGKTRGLNDRTGLNNSTVAICSAMYRLAVTDGNAISPTAILNIYNTFKPQIDKVCSIVTRKRVSNAPVMAAVVLHMKQGNHEAFNQYVAMVKVVTSEMKPATAYLFKSLLDTPLNGSSRERHIVMTRAYRAFHPKHCDSNGIRINDIDKAVDSLRAQVASILGTDLV